MSTKVDFQSKLLVYQRQLELSFFKNVAKHNCTNCSFSVLFSVVHQGQDYSYLDKSIVSWIESLIDVTTSMCLIVPLRGVLATLKKWKSLASFPLQILYYRTFNINSHIVLLRNWEKKEKQGNKKKSLIRKKGIVRDSNSWPLGLEATALTTSLWEIHDSRSLYFLFIDNRYL